MSDQPGPKEPLTEQPKEQMALPDILPIFPLSGVLLLPRGRLPLNIFEPRYLAMTRYALGGERLIGMVQPSDPAKDHTGGGPGINAPGINAPGIDAPGIDAPGIDAPGIDAPGIDAMSPPVYPIGCAGRLTQFSETDDGRYLITLTGVSRFRIREELPLLSGYRRIVPDWRPFAHDRAATGKPGFDRERLIRGLKSFFAMRQISADWEAIDKAPGEYLVASLAMACPFAPSEKQALLEAANPDARAELLTTLVEMAALKPTGEESGGTRH